MLYALDLFGTFVFALSGAFRAVKYELDLLGVLVLATATGVGGGVIRDLLLGHTPPFALKDEAYLLTCLAGGLVVFLASRHIASHWDCVMAADALGLAVFAAIGAAKGAIFGLGNIGIILMGTLTATGGGVIRDVLVAEIPAILRTDFYATAALLGSVCFLFARILGFSQGVQVSVCIAVTLILRLLAMRYQVSLPKVSRLPSSPSRLTQLRKTEKGREEERH